MLDKFAFLCHLCHVHSIIRLFWEHLQSDLIMADLGSNYLQAWVLLFGVVKSGVPAGKVDYVTVTIPNVSEGHSVQK